MDGSDSEESTGARHLDNEDDEDDRRPNRSTPASYDKVQDHHTINPGLKTAMGSHQGSMLKAVNRAKIVKESSGGLITIKKLLTRRAIDDGVLAAF